MFLEYECFAFCYQERAVRIGCSSGFWGDSTVAAPQLIQTGNLNYLVADYLSEITMSLLTAAKHKMPDMGYAPDFVQAAVGPYLAGIKANGVKVVSNAGGINPIACAHAVREAAKKAGVDLKVASIVGDDIMSRHKELMQAGIVDMFSGANYPSTMTSMTAYLGAGAIAKALDMGADIVVTGRCTDSALVLGPLMHEFKWSPTDYDLLASGSLAGHLIECGAQVTGGNFTDWQSVPDWHNIGFPIVECNEDGSFIVTKPPNTGGIVTPATCAEQMLYEIGDPAAYVLPDVSCDFRGVRFESVQGKEGEAVLATGARGSPPGADYKISGTYADGYRLTGVFPVVGPKAAEKGLKTATAILTRVRGILKKFKMDDFTQVNLKAIGTEHSYGEHASRGNSREVVIWLAVQHQNKKALQLLSMEIAPAGTGMAPGLTGIVGGRPKVSPVLKLFSFLHPKNQLDVKVDVAGETHSYSPVVAESFSRSQEAPAAASSEGETWAIEHGVHTYRLQELAYTRSGDKGNNCNIGVIARHPAFVPYLRASLTEEAVGSYMRHVFEDEQADGKVQRYEVPGVNGFNFVLQDSLGGGGISSVRMDPQGKAYGQILLDFPIKNMPPLPDIIRGAHIPRDLKRPAQ